MVTQEVDVNLIPGGVPPVINVNQYDKGSRVLKLHLFLGQEEYQIPEDAAAYIQGTKPDGNGFLYVCSFDGNTIIADLTDQMTVLPGVVRCEAFLQEEVTRRIGTANFVLLVERATLQDPEDHLSETEIPLIGTLAEASLKAMNSSSAAKKSEENALASEKKAATSQKAAKASEDNAKASQDASKQSEANAKNSADQAAESKEKASQSELNAKAYAKQAAESKDSANAAQDKAISYAIGGTGTRTGEDIDNAKYYAAEAKNAAQTEKGSDLLEASGSGFVLDNAADAAFHSLTVEGKSTQKKYEGYNLCGGEYMDERWWAHKDADLLAILNSLPVGTYRAMTAGKIRAVDSDYNADISGSLLYGIAIYASNKEFFSTQSRYSSNSPGTYTSNSKTFQITEENQGKFTDFYQYTCGAGKDGAHGRGDLWIMITAGKDEKAFEPYVGGKASPNPDYPQEIVSLQNETITFQSKNILTNAGPFHFNSDAGPAIISKTEAKQLFEKFYGKKAYVSFDIEASADFVEGSRKRFGLENTVVGMDHKTYYEAFQLWFESSRLEAGTKKHLSGEVLIGKGVPVDLGTIDIDSVFFYVQCISSGNLTVTNLQMEIADAETSYESPETSLVTLPYTLRSIDDIHDELTVREDGTGTLIQRIWHKELPIAAMNNSEDYPGWQGINIRAVITGGNGPLKTNNVKGYCNIDPDLSGIDVNTVGNNDIVFIGSVLSKLTQSEWKEAYPDLIVTLDLPYLNPVVTELTADEVSPLLTAQTYRPQTVVYADGNENITLQYYNSTVQGGLDQIKRLRNSLAAEIKRAGAKETELQESISKETDRAKLAENKTNEILKAESEKLAKDEETLNGLHTALGTLEVMSFTRKCLAGGGFGTERIATFPSYPVSLWINSKLEGSRSLVLSTHAYSDGWFVNVTDNSGMDITDLELTIKALIATPVS